MIYKLNNFFCLHQSAGLGEWGMRQERKSPDYTSDWAQVPASEKLNINQAV